MSITLSRMFWCGLCTKSSTYDSAIWRYILCSLGKIWSQIIYCFRSFYKYIHIYSLYDIPYILYCTPSLIIDTSIVFSSVTRAHGIQKQCLSGSNLIVIEIISYRKYYCLRLIKDTWCRRSSRPRPEWELNMYIVLCELRMEYLLDLLISRWPIYSYRPSSMARAAISTPIP